MCVGDSEVSLPFVVVTGRKSRQISKRALPAREHPATRQFGFILRKLSRELIPPKSAIISDRKGRWGIPKGEETMGVVPLRGRPDSSIHLAKQLPLLRATPRPLSKENFFSQKAQSLW